MKLLANKDARPSREEIEQMIAKAAYFRAEKRCFEVGYEQEDWLMAEQEINQLYVFESWKFLSSWWSLLKVVITGDINWLSNEK